MDDDDQSSYTNAHRALLQAFFANTTFTLRTVQPVLAAILTIHERRDVLPHDITEADLASHISTINASISAYDLEIRSTLTQPGQSTRYGDAPDNDDAAGASRVKVYALVNTTSDAIAQLATTHTADEMAFASRVLDDMFDKYNVENGKEIMAITHMQATRLNKVDGSSRAARASNVGTNGVNGTEEGTQAQTQTSAQGLTMAQAEKMLASMVDEGWLEKTGARDKSYYILTPRALMELKGWLVETYNEPPDLEAPSDDEEGPGRRGVERIKMCAACREIVLSGQRCPDKRCRARLHDACTGAMWRSQRGRRECPQCQREWGGEDFVGVRAAGVSLSGGRRAGVRREAGRSSVGGAREGSSNGIRRSRAVVDEEDDDVDQTSATRTAGGSFATNGSSSTGRTLGRRGTSGMTANGSRRTSAGRGTDVMDEDDE